MYPDLSYFLHDLLGTEYDNFFSIFKTFGLFLVFAFIGSAYILSLEYKRMEKASILSPLKKIITFGKTDAIKAILSNSIVGFILGFKLPHVYNNFDAFKQDPSSILFSTSGNILLGIILLILFAGYSYYQNKSFINGASSTEEKTIYPHQKVGDIAILAAISGVAGARFFSILENAEGLMNDPVGTIFSGSGLTVYGGLIVASIVVLYYIKKLGMPLLHSMDAAAPAIVTGMLIGRLGCQFSGDGDWGIVNAADKPSWFIFPDWVWSYSYPNNVNRAGVAIEDCVANYCNQMIPGVFPTPIYEVTMYALVFLILWRLRTKIKAPGVLFFIWMIFSGITRFLIEFIRVNDRYNVLGFEGSQAHFISIGFMVVGLIGSVYLFKSYNKSSVP